MSIDQMETAFDDFRKAVISKDAELIDDLAWRLQRSDLTRIDGVQLVDQLNGCRYSGLAETSVGFGTLKFDCPSRAREDRCETGDQELIVLPKSEGVLAEILEVRNRNSDCLRGLAMPPPPQ